MITGPVSVFFQTYSDDLLVLEFVVFIYLVFTIL